VAANLDESMAVGVGFEYHQHGHTSALPEQLVVSGQPGKVDVQHSRPQDITQCDGRFVDLRHLAFCVPRSPAFTEGAVGPVLADGLKSACLPILQSSVP
jgi:hypothetical protein